MTKLTLQIDDKIATFECPRNDMFCYEIIEGFIGVMVAHTFKESTVLNSMKDYAEGNYPNEQL